MSKNMTKQPNPIYMRPETAERFRCLHAAHIAHTGKVISFAAYLDIASILVEENKALRELLARAVKCLPQRHPKDKLGPNSIEACMAKALLDGKGVDGG